MSSGLDSHAAFKARALEIGLSPDVIELLKAGGVTSFGSYAFVTSYQPGQPDETPLIEALTKVMHRAPSTEETIPLRRLFFESCTLAISDLKQRTERDETAEPSRMPVAERNARLQEQQNRLKGIHFSPETEPSHKLVDLVCQMSTDQTLEWIPWEKLTSRASEVTHTQKDLKLAFDATGSLKVAHKDQTPDAAVTGELKVRQALNRRSRAFDLAKLCSFTRMEEWHERVFEVLQKEPAANAMPVTLQQVREADKTLFKKLSEKTRGRLTQAPDGAKPMDTFLDACMDSAEVQFCLIPMVRAARVPPTLSHSDHPKGGGKGKWSKPKSNFVKGQQKGLQLPPNCHQMTPDKKPICNNFNRTSCPFAKEGKRCKRGFHVCWQCFKPKPHHSCDHS